MLYKGGSPGQVMGSNPGAGYCMDLTFFHIVLFV